MTLGELLAGAALAPEFLDVAIGGLAADSRAVTPGDLFVALRGTKADGLHFVADAVRSGAVAVMGEEVPDPPLPAGVPFIAVDDARRALAHAAARFFPRQPDMIAAVTGTSGKTSVVAFVRQIWSQLGRPAASIGTLGLISPHGEVAGSLTTPDPIRLHRTLSELVGDGVSHLALEASSHGLDQRRLDGVRVRIGAFTNLTRDHLDYHPSLQAYLSAKLRLFETLIAADGGAVIDADTPHSDAFVRAAQARRLSLLTVGRAGADLRLLEARIDGLGQRLRLDHCGQNVTLRLPLVGHFQVENALLAAGIAIASGEDPRAVFAALEQLKGAKGRLELVGRKNDATIFVDYAHKPDALAKALDALRAFASGRLVVVFGAGGDRDTGKRPIMGAIAAEKADRVIVTDDNPRSEDPAAIRAAILAAAPGAREIGDRGAAIAAAMAELEPGDALLIAGKGHESGQIVGDRVRPFTDHEAVAAALRNGVR
ncbi:MAG TPA: UDP-N-acetylmuramoyl-L-alanyl-D-glutamate--2,6-diaminopimelate ligase [Xanthobacteraceae bacterium]|nr:UDP-N-acetylmuramoyl-L-alanyl-D-glutamate--2,6-diaminopimelate ligase [Xanthobacteraceae bacterium]